MANINYDWYSLDELKTTKLLTFSDVPNILSIKEDITGTKAVVNFFCDDGMRSSVTGDGQYYVTFMGETVTNVIDGSVATNKRFYIDNDGDSTAMSLGRALRCCGGINADWDVVIMGSDVYLIAKTLGSKWSNISNVLQYSMPSGFSPNATAGSVSSVYFGSQFVIDVFKTPYSNRANYITTLEKNWYGDECSFNLSPVLATISEYGQTTPYDLVISCVTDAGQYQREGLISGCCTTVGYKANDSNNTLRMEGAADILIQNTNGGGTLTLYTYSSEIDYSVLLNPTASTWNAKFSVKNSAGQQIYSASTLGYSTTSSKIQDAKIIIPDEYMDSAYYVDLTVDNNTNGTVRFNVIKPLKAAEYYQRVYWRNEYGGLSYFDFTGSKSESTSVDIETYEKNIFDYYQVDYYEKKKIYKNDYKKEVTLTSHLMEETGKDYFNSLMKSKSVWTIIDGDKYYIIPKSITIEEDNTYDGIFTAKLVYTYSDI